MSSSVISLSLEAKTCVAPCLMMDNISSLPSLFMLGSTSRPVREKDHLFRPDLLQPRLGLQQGELNSWGYSKWLSATLGTWTGWVFVLCFLFAIRKKLDANLWALKCTSFTCGNVCIYVYIFCILHMHVNIFKRKICICIYLAGWQ